jgi:hypothetical protein
VRRVLASAGVVTQLRPIDVPEVQPDDPVASDDRPLPLRGHGISVVTEGLWSLRIFYQLLEGQIGQRRYLDGEWIDEDINVRAVSISPLASVTYDGGKEVSRPYFRSTRPNGWYVIDSLVPPWHPIRCPRILLL